MNPPLNSEDLRRLNTWVGAIARVLRPDAPMAHTVEGLRLGRKGSLSIASNCRWFDHESGKGGPDALSLIRHLRGCSAEAAVFWAQGWLEQHLGDGDLHTEVDAEAGAAEASARSAAWATQVVDDATEPLGTPAEDYLRNRGLTPPYPPVVRWLEVARFAESAVVGRLTKALGDPVGVQLGYIDPRGRKSIIRPQRQLFLIDRDAARQGAFRIDVPEPVAGAPEFIITEGLENALALAQAAVAKVVLGIPGVGRFSAIDLPPDAGVVVFRDGKDEADSPAAKAFITAIDRWLLAQVKIRITGTPSGEDANSLLLGHGPEELRRLVNEAAPGELSFHGELKRLFDLDPVERERERATAARKHGVRRSFLDDALQAMRDEAKVAAEQAAEDDPPYHEPVTDLAPVLDAALVELQRYVVAPQYELATTVVWCLHAHLVHGELVFTPISPKLAIQGPDKGCGKTTLLEGVGTLVPRAETGSSITAAAIFRLIEARRPTLLIDEADRVLRSSNEELIAVLNSSHRRSGAYVWRVEEIARKRVATKFSTWGAIAFAGIRELPETLQDRSIVIRLTKAKPGEVKSHLRNGTSPTLKLIKAKFARWALDLKQLPEPTMPAGLHNRLGDNWAPLFAIAELAGGRWPELMQRAALSAISADQSEGQLVALLDGIRRAFGEKERIGTKELIDFLLADDEFDWSTANHGKPINDAWLRERLRNVITPAADGKPGSERWGSDRNKVRGYSRSRLFDAWERYLSVDPRNTRSTRSGADNSTEIKANSWPDEEKNNRSDTGGIRSASRNNGDGPDARGHGAGCDDPHATRKNQTESEPGPDGPGGPGDLGSSADDAFPEMPNFLRRTGPDRGDRSGNGEEATPPKWEPL